MNLMTLKRLIASGAAVAESVAIRLPNPSRMTTSPSRKGWRRRVSTTASAGTIWPG